LPWREGEGRLEQDFIFGSLIGWLVRKREYKGLLEAYLLIRQRV